MSLTIRRDPMPLCRAGGGNLLALEAGGTVFTEVPAVRRNDGDWFPLSSDFTMHSKTLHLCDLLGQELADAYPVRLMTWLRDQENVTGEFRSAAEVEIVARWKGTKGLLVKALQEAGILDGLVYHNWASKGGRAVSRMIARRKHGDNSARTDVATPSPSPSPSLSSSVVKGGGVGEVDLPSGPGWSPNREAVHLAQRWSAINAKGLCAPEKASQHFQAGLDAGIDAHALMAAVEANKGRKPFEIVDALKPKMAGGGPRNFADEAAARAERAIPTAAKVAAEKDAAFEESKKREAALTPEQRAENRRKLEEARKKLEIA